MRPALWLLCLLPLRASADDSKCVAGFRRLLLVPEVRVDLEGGLDAKALAPDGALERRFVERCRSLPSEAVACLSTVHDLKSAYLCAGTKALAPSVKSLLSPERSGELARDRADAETHALVRAIATYAAGLARDKPVSLDFTLPEATPLTPATTCCSHEGGECPVNSKEWTHPTWVKLKFHPSQSLLFQYRFTSSGKGPTARFVVQAIGDPTCTGKPETWQITGSVHDGRLARDTWDAVRVP